MDHLVAKAVRIESIGHGGLFVMLLFASCARFGIIYEL